MESEDSLVIILVVGSEYKCRLRTESFFNMVCNFFLLRLQINAKKSRHFKFENTDC